MKGCNVPGNTRGSGSEDKQIYTDFGDALTRMEWMTTIYDVHEQASAYDGVVHVIHDFRRVNYRMMSTSLKHAVDIANSIPPNVHTYIVLTNSRLILFVGKTVKRFVPKVSHKIHFVADMEAAARIIEYNRTNT